MAGGGYRTYYENDAKRDLSVAGLTLREKSELGFNLKDAGVLGGVKGKRGL